SASASAAAAAHRKAATMNPPLNPCVSATGSGAPPCSAWVTRVVATVERIASPIAPPTCCVVLSRPDARPESSGATPVVAEIVIGTNDNPRPIPSDSDTTALNLAGAGDLARRVARVNPNAVLAVV